MSDTRRWRSRLRASRAAASGSLWATRCRRAAQASRPGHRRPDLGIAATAAGWVCRVQPPSPPRRQSLPCTPFMPSLSGSNIGGRIRRSMGAEGDKNLQDMAVSDGPQFPGFSPVPTPCPLQEWGESRSRPAESRGSAARLATVRSATQTPCLTSIRKVSRAREATVASNATRSAKPRAAIRAASMAKRNTAKRRTICNAPSGGLSSLQTAPAERR